jgi:dTDP-4-dehydrorhamnose 3,5-epimerase
MSAFYTPAHESGIRWNDPDIGIAWPVEQSSIIISEKDRRLPLLKEFESPFDYDGLPLRPLSFAEAF